MLKKTLESTGWLDTIWNSVFLKPFICWVVWMVVGAAYYATALDLGWSKGFYMAVNVGYSIGWGYPTEDSNGSRIFSTIYVLVGASAVAASLGFFAQSMIVSSKDWYASALQREKYERATAFKRFKYWIRMNEGALKIIGIWTLWIILMIIFSMSTVKWNFTEGLYFAVSSLSTGGLWAIPSDSPDWYFGVVGCFACTGVPLMALAMANIASMLISIGDPDEAEKAIAAKVTREELDMMKRFELDDGDGQITRAEYILLCTVRLGALSPELIGKINERFKELDTSGDGTLSYDEITETPAARLSHSGGSGSAGTGAAAAGSAMNTSALHVGKSDATTRTAAPTAGPGVGGSKSAASKAKGKGQRANKAEEAQQHLMDIAHPHGAEFNL